MSDLPAQPPTGNQPEFTVSELSNALKRTVEDSFSYVRVRGEISGFKRAGSGHCYMALKDESAVLDAVCWRGTAMKLSVQPEDGLEVIVTGKLTTYPARSRYQLVIESVELSGEGALLKLLEERRRKLAAEGLFDEGRKRPIPYLPEVIGVVTSPTGAVIRDILHRLAERFPRRVLLWPVAVQGETAAQQIAAAIAGFNRLAADGPVPRPDVLIVARGGGSLEDLWAFNEEIVVRAAAESAIPLISAVGHETDTTLIDFASDRRAPTPTAAAEIAVPVRSELAAIVADRRARMVGAAGRMVADRRMRIEGLSRGLPDLDSLLGNARQRLDSCGERLGNASANGFERRRNRLATLGARLKSPRDLVQEEKQRVATAWRDLRGEVRQFLALEKSRSRAMADRLSLRPAQRAASDGRHRLGDLGARLDAAALRRQAEATNRLAGLADLLESYSFRRVLERGYAVVRDAAGQPVTHAAATAAGSGIAIEFQDGTVGATVDGPVEGGAAAPPGSGQKTEKVGRGKPEPEKRQPEKAGAEKSGTEKPRTEKPGRAKPADRRQRSLF